MRILFGTILPYLPVSTGGVQRTLHALAKALTARGHDVLVLGAASMATDPARVNAVFPYDGFSYGVAHAGDPLAALPGILSGWQPDIAVLSFAGEAAVTMTMRCLRAGVPVAQIVHNIDSAFVTTVVPDHPLLCRIANSHFTARRIATLFGVDLPVIPPLIDPADCVFDPRHRGQGDSVLLVNPSIIKGSEIFFQLAAARPDLRFRTIESWSIDPNWRLILHNRAAALGNVEIMTATDDMREIYRRARIILMPSVHEETWGRVASEAQLNGIPVIAADRGALPETVGEGGLLVPIDQGISPWVDALDRLTNDDDLYRRLAAAALAHAARPEQSADILVPRFIALLRDHLSAAGAVMTGGAPRPA